MRGFGVKSLNMLPKLPSAEWSPQAAAHLLARAGFGGTPAEVRRLYEMGMEGAVRELVEVSDSPDWLPAPADAAKRDMEEQREMRQNAMTMSEEDRRAAQKQIQELYHERTVALRQWWLERMRQSSHPLREKLTLFWHGHFATSIQKVRVPYLMYSQNELFRKWAFGPLPELTKCVSQDPAMMRYLDLTDSRKEAPNENYAREVMELFTLGEGHYSEDDIREAARAFTGYRMAFDGSVRLIPKQHDDGQKVFFGKTGPFTGSEIVDIIYQQLQSAKFLTAKLWTYFAGTPPTRALNDLLAKRLRESRHALKPWLIDVFSSREFYSTRVVRKQIKSPVQFIVQSCKQLEIPLPGPQFTQSALRQLGQELFLPPNVKGWDGQYAWITSSTLVNRYNLSGILTGANPQRGYPAPELTHLFPSDKRADPERILADLQFRFYGNQISEKTAQPFREYLTKIDLSHPSNTETAALFHLMMSIPEYQLT